MYTSYADVLESYMIAEEGLFSKFKKNKESKSTPQNKTSNYTALIEEQQEIHNMPENDLDETCKKIMKLLNFDKKYLKHIDVYRIGYDKSKTDDLIRTMFGDFQLCEKMHNKIKKEITKGNKIPKSDIESYLSSLDKWRYDLKDTVAGLISSERVARENIADPEGNLYLEVNPRDAAENFNKAQKVIYRMTDMKIDVEEIFKRMNK